MTITGGTALPREEIDRMVAEAEKHAGEEHKRREEAEARNQADNVIYTVEKSLADVGDKVSEEERGEIAAKLETAKEALKGEDVDKIKQATEELLQASHKLAEQAYSQQQAASGGTGEAAQSTDDDSDVVEGEVVDDEGEAG